MTYYLSDTLCILDFKIKNEAPFVIIIKVNKIPMKESMFLLIIRKSVKSLNIKNKILLLK